MNTLRHISVQLERCVVQLVSVTLTIVLIALMPTTALAAPPATVASCSGIKNAYLTLGTQCATAYAGVDHQPDTVAGRLASFVARRTVLQIFQKALLCNGMYGASSAVQQLFKSGEEGHLTALANLRAAMENHSDPNIPAAYLAADLKNISIRKQQCK